MSLFKYLLCFIFANLLSFTSFGQYSSPTILDSGITLHQIVDSLKADPQYTNDTSEDGFRTKVDQFNHFWQGRVYENGGSGQDMFRTYYKSLQEGVQARLANQCSNNGYQGNWSCIGPKKLSTQQIGYITDIWADQTAYSHDLLAATYGGLFKSTTDGTYWECLTDNSIMANGILCASNIAVKPDNHDVIYLGTSGNFYTNEAIGITGFLHQGAGLLKSKDGGATWQQEVIDTGDPWDPIQRAYKVFFSPDGTRLYAFCQSGYNTHIYTKLYTTTNWNTVTTTWERITPTSPTLIPDAEEWVNLQFVPGDASADPSRHFFACSGINIGGSVNTTVWEFTYSSSTWTKTNITTGGHGFSYGTGPYLQMTISIPNNQTLFCAAISAAGNQLYSYNLSTGQWATTIVNTSLPTCVNHSQWSHFNINVSPNNPQNIYFGDDCAFVSNDGGATFTQISAYWGSPTHGDIRSIFIHTSTTASTANPNGKNDIVYIGTDGGVGKKPAGSDPASLDSFTTIDISGTGLACGHFFTVSTSEEAGTVVGASTHNGTHEYEPDQAVPWGPILDGDNWSTVFDRGANRSKAYSIKGYGGNGMRASGTASSRKIDSWGLASFTDPNDGGNPSPPFFADNLNNIFLGQYRLWEKATTASQLVASGNITYGLPTNGGLAIQGLSLNPYAQNSHPVGYVLYSKNTGIANSLKLYYRNPPSTNTANNPSQFEQRYAPAGNAMTDVTMDPLDPNRVWVSMGELVSSTYPVGRVFYSPSGGDASNHWYDISAGLPNELPVAKIIYQEGSNFLYCATEVGIYVMDFTNFNSASVDAHGVNNSVSWKCFNKGATALGEHDFPCVYVTDLEINYCEGKLYASTYGRSLWSTDLMVEGATSPYDFAIGDRVPAPSLVINSSPTWNTDQYLTTSVRVTTGNTLTISSGAVIHMPQNGYIRVDAGATLIVDHATITNDCHAFWKGIITYGNSGLTQMSNTQPHVIIRNGALIENARAGVCNYAESVAGFNTAGAVINADNSTFLNCARGVVFAPYHNYYGSNTDTKANDMSSFLKDTFKITNDYHGEKYGYNFSAHATMVGVYGINFTGCRFLNECTSSVCPNNVGVGAGIGKYSSSISVNAYCASCGSNAAYLASTSLVRSKFSGLQAGIVNWGDNQNNYLYVDHADFDKCSAGIYSSNQQGLNLFYNTFGIANAYYNFCSPYSYSTTSYTCNQVGIVAVNSNRFKIEENSFTKTGTNTNGTGVYLENVDTFDQDVYRNSFKGLNNAFDARGKNAYWPVYPTPLTKTTGVQFLCNNDTDIDKADLNANTIAFADAPAMRLMQGSVTKPTGNTFKKTSPSGIGNGETWLEWSTTPTNIQYFWHATNESISTSATYYPNFWSIQTSATKQCSSRQQVVKDFPTDIRAHKDASEIAYNTSKADYLAAVGSLDALLNGGNTGDLLDFIDARTIDQAPEIHDQIQNFSPYVTEEIFRDLAYNERVPEEMMIELLTNNPEVCRNADFISFLTNDVPHPYGSDVLHSIADLGHSTTDRSTAEAAIMDSHHEMMLAAHDVIWAIMADSAGMDIDTLAKWYKEIPLLSNRYALASLYLEKVDSPKMWTALNDISTDFTLGTAETNEYNSYKDLYTIIYHIKADGRNEMAEMDSTELAQTDSIAMRGHGNASSTALSLYQQNLNLVPYTCVNDPSLGLRPGPKAPVIAKTSDNNLRVYPNPAKEYVNFEYNEPLSSGDLQLTITNITGQQVFIKPLKDKKGMAWWDTRQMIPGVYLYKVTDSKKILQSGKLTILGK